MAGSINTSCQHVVRSALRAARDATQKQPRTTRLFSAATSRSESISRADETEEIPMSLQLDNLSSLAHTELQAHRELRNLARLAAWEMPLLSTLSKPFEPPTMATPLRWRYTTYMGELHPAAHKVVVEFCLRDLKDINEEQKQTLRKLAGSRWDPASDIIKMSCESFQTQAQNKRYLGETIAALIKEAKEGEDKFTDVALDLRHAAARAKKRLRRSPGVKFPAEWRMTPERRAELDAKRRKDESSSSSSSSSSATEASAQLAAPEGTVTTEQALAAVRRAAVAAGELDAESQADSTSQKKPTVSGVEAIEKARKAEAARRAAEPVAVPAGPIRRRR